MDSIEISKIINKLNSTGYKSVYNKPALLEDINKFEEINKVKLPKQYKEWLLFTNGCDLLLPAGVQFYGINTKPQIDINNNDRPSKEYIVIGSLDNGDPVLFKNGEEKIIIYNHETGIIEEDEIYDDLTTFFNDINNILGMDN